ncbi:hypothetical protein [Nakamurella deserti]|uniref:hypothetical protein n=1 Tax=Nakamurella deserti TaxID=2164074 RepID=UPI000DBE966A|nr:hypothetical protein [Nakamurella deserti]
MTPVERVVTSASVRHLTEATLRHREAAEAHAQLRQALAASSRRLRAAQQDRDDAVRAARADGLTYRELELVTGYSRGWLDRIISHRMDRHSRHR